MENKSINNIPNQKKETRVSESEFEHFMSEFPCLADKIFKHYGNIAMECAKTPAIDNIYNPNDNSN